MSSTTVMLPTILLPGSSAFAALMTIQLRNIDALAAAQKSAMAGLGKLAQRQTAILAAGLQGATATPAGLLDGDAEGRITKPIDAVKTAILDHTAHTNALSEIAALTSAGVAGILQDRMMAALDELKAALIGAIPPAAR